MEIQIVTDAQGRPTYFFGGVVITCPPKIVKDFFLRYVEGNDKVQVSYATVSNKNAN